MRDIQKVKELLKGAKNIVVLTGAGMSTASGIPDFRSKTGLYKSNPENILSREYFFKKPKKFYEFIKDNMYYPEAKPNLGHEILADWEKQGKKITIITQNVDGFHKEAGNKEVIEFHGTIKTAKCHNKDCQKEYILKDIMEKEKQEEDFFYCDCETKEQNQRIIKPNVVLFGEEGEWFDKSKFYELCCMVYDADLVFILGTSLQVYPFSELPKYRNIDHKTPMVIVNKGKTSFDNKEYVYTYDEDISKILNLINEK